MALQHSNAEPTTGTNGATVFKAVFTTINLTPLNYFNNRKTIPRNNHVAPLNKPGLIPLVAGFTASPIPKADINTINNRSYVFYFKIIFLKIFIAL